MVNTDLKEVLIAEVNSYVEELGIANECTWSSDKNNELYLEIPYRKHKLCICPCYEDENGEHMALFCTDSIDDMHEIHTLLESINEKLLIKG